MMRTVWVIACVLVLPVHAWAEDLYFGQAAAGANNGTSCANQLSAAAFNTAGNWGAGAGKVSAGDTAHLCGTITTTLATQGAGTNGNVITILWESGAKLSQPVCSFTTGCINAWTDYITLDGGTNGIVEGTANGSGLGNDTNTVGVWLIGTGITAKNLIIRTLYVHTYNSSATTSPDANYGVRIDGGTNITVNNNTISDVKYGIYRIPSVSGSNHNYFNNTISKTNWAFAPLAAGVGITLDTVNIYGNDVEMDASWDAVDNGNHHNGAYTYTDESPATGTVSNLNFYNNYIHGLIAAPQSWTSTGMFFTTGRIVAPNIFNNVLAGISGAPANGYVTIAFGNSVVEALTARIVNNTIIGISTTGSVNQYGTSSPSCLDVTANSNTTATFQNNICSTNPYGFRTTAGSTLVSNYNVLFNLGSVGVINGTTRANFAAWQAAGYDANGSSGDPMLSAIYSLNSSSPAISLGTNLYSTCNGQPNPGLGALCLDKNGVARSVEGRWDAGAYVYIPSGGGGSSPPPSPATGRTAASTRTQAGTRAAAGARTLR